MTEKLQIVVEEVSDYMDHILKLFKPGAKITVCVRNPQVPGDTDFILTNDDLTEARAALQRQQERHQSKQASPI
jgi:hypothetical protein